MPTLLEIARQSREAVRNNKISKLENGEYSVEVQSPELRHRNDGQGSYILLPLRITDGEFEDLIIPDIFSFHPRMVRSSVYNLEDLLEVCSIEFDDADYTNVNTLYNALNRHFGESESLRQVKIKYVRDGGTVRIDYLKDLTGDSDTNEEIVDLSEIPF